MLSVAKDCARDTLELFNFTLIMAQAGYTWRERTGSPVPMYENMEAEALGTNWGQVANSQNSASREFQLFSFLFS